MDKLIIACYRDNFIFIYIKMVLNAVYANFLLFLLKRMRLRKRKLF